jgi:ribonuclease E
MATQQRMLIDATQMDEVRVALVKDESELLDFDFESQSKKSIKGNIYLGKIVRIEPSLQAAFVEYGRNRHGFLAFTEIHPDYFRIPVADREELIQTVSGDALPLEGESGPISDDAGLIEGTSPAPEQPKEASPEETGEEENRRKYALYRNYKIQEVIKSRQIVLIQVVKEERGNKGAALTTFISLAGRYSVLMPNALHAGGISRKITESDDRKRLKKLMSDLEVPEGMSLIVRTAGLNRTKNEIKRDYSYLINLWSKIREKTLSATAPELIYEEPSLIRRVLRDVYTPDIVEILVEGDEGYKEAKSFMKILIPSHVKRIKQYKEKNQTLFKKHNVENQIEQIFSPQVKLKSGGYLVINSTEALVAIDVNSGRATRERHIDTTALKTNLEAAEEVARQVRIRDLSGLIVIDFIDMSDVRHNIAVEKRLKESLSMDRARIQVGRISQFGLLEMSRQRLRSSILEASSSRCPYCSGSGLMRSKESLSVQLLRILEELVATLPETDSPLTVRLESSLAFFLLGHKRRELEALEEKRPQFFVLKQDESLGFGGFKIENKEGVFIADSSGTPVAEPSGPVNKKNNRNNTPSPHVRKKSVEGKVGGESSPNHPSPKEENIAPETPLKVATGGEEPQSTDTRPEEKKQQGRNRHRRNRRRNQRSSHSLEKNEERELGVETGLPQESSFKEEALVRDTSPTFAESEKIEITEEKHSKKSKTPPKSGWWKKLLD